MTTALDDPRADYGPHGRAQVRLPCHACGEWLDVSTLTILTIRRPCGTVAVVAFCDGDLPEGIPAS